MNRKGNIAFLMLPVVALLACTLGIFSYLALDDGFGEASSKLAGMSGKVNVMQDYIESSAKLVLQDYIKSGLEADSIRESAARRDLHIEGEGNLFSKMQAGEFTATKSGDLVRIEVKDVFIQAREGENLWERRWDMVIEGSSDGSLIRFINK